LQLASEAKVAFAKLKYKLNSKLSFAFQKAIISHFNTESTFYEFAKQYTIYDQSLKAIKERESRVQKPRDANKTNTPTATAPATTITTTLPITPRANTF
jgi:lysozyme family protein